MLLLIGVGGSSCLLCHCLLLRVPKACDLPEPVVNRAEIGTLIGGEGDRQRERERGVYGGRGRGW